MVKVAVIGSREFTRTDLVTKFILSLPADTIVVSGGARGVDRIAVETAKAIGLETKIFEAEWNLYGLKAGHIRNRILVKYCDRVYAFWNGTSRGSYDTIKQAKALGKPVTVFSDLDSILEET